MTEEEVIKNLKDKLNSNSKQMNCTNPNEVYEEAVRLLSEPYWQTEEPTEVGLYLCCVVDWKDMSRKYEILDKENLSNWYEHREFLAWHKIPPYEEQK